MALKGDSVTFDGEMGPSFIRHGAADPCLWVVCETAPPPALSLNFASNRGKCPRVLLFGVGGSRVLGFLGPHS